MRLLGQDAESGNIGILNDSVGNLNSEEVTIWWYLFSVIISCFIIIFVNYVCIEWIY